MEGKAEIMLRDDTDITAGGKARQEDILKEVATSDILFYLVSAASLASKNCNRELTEAVQVGSRVFPIILENCDWLNDRLSNFQALPNKGKPINKWQPESDGWQNVVDGIRKAIEEMQAQSDSSSETSERKLRAELAFQHGNVFMMIGQVNLAIDRYSHAIELNPNIAFTYNNRGTAYYHKCEYAKAVTDYTRTTELLPDYVEAYNNCGLAYYKKAEYDRAIDSFTKAIELKPDVDQYYNHRGVAYNGKCDFDSAVEDFNKSLELNPDSADAYNNRGNAYQGKDIHDRAIEDYTAAVELRPDYADAYYNRGNTYRGKKEYDRAIKDYDTAIQLNSKLAEAYQNRGNVYYERGKVNHAIKDYNMLIQLKPKSADAYYRRSMAYFNKGEIDRAIKDLNTTIKLRSNDADAYYNRGVAYGIKGENELAILDYGKAIKFRSDYVEVYCNRGVTFCNKGEVDLAIADFNNAIQIKPDFAEAYINRGYAYGKKHGYGRAIKDYETAINLNPTLAEAYNNRGVVYNKQDDYERAIIDYNTAIKLNPDYAEAYYNRGEVWLQQRDWEKAREDLNTARDKDADIIAGFQNDYKSVKDFEKRHRVNLPEDIAAMLTQPRHTRFPRTEKFLSSDGTPFESPDVLNLQEKLRNAGTPLSDYIQTRPSFGTKTGSSGAFVVDSATRDRLIADYPSSVEVLKPFLHGRDIRRWRVARPDAWLIFTYRGIEINCYPAIRNHLETYRSTLSKRSGKQKWYELPAAKSDAGRFLQTKLVCPNSYDHQTFAVDTEGFYCGDTCYLIPTEEMWLCSLLNSRIVEWFYSQTSNQLTGDYLKARSRYMQQIPVPDLTSEQKGMIAKFVDYLIYLQGQPTTSGGDLAHARDFIMLGYFERIVDGLVYESYLREELHHGDKHFFKPLVDEGLPQIEEIRGDKMASLREIFERLYERTHPVRSNLFFLDSVKPIRIIEGKA